jgi:hypothetical protein
MNTLTESQFLEQIMTIINQEYNLHLFESDLFQRFVVHPKNGNPPYIVGFNEDLEQLVKAIYNQKFIWAERAIRNCLFELAYTYNADITDDELETFKNYQDEAPAEEGFNRWYDTFFPMLLERIEFRNQQLDGPSQSLKLYQFGHELRVHDEPIVIDWVFEAGRFDISAHQDHKAKICEDGRIVLTSLTDSKGAVLDCTNLDVDCPEGLPLMPEPLDWANIKPERARLYEALSAS